MKKLIFMFLLLLLLSGCSNNDNSSLPIDIMSGKDYQPPVMTGYSSLSGNEVQLHFDESITADSEDFPSYKISCTGNDLNICFEEKLKPGQKRILSGRVCDNEGNSTGFSITVWGKNDFIPPVLINEVTTKATTKKPPQTEIKVLGDGNIGGMTLYCGIPGDWDSCFIFPDMEVKKYSYIVVWWTNKKVDNNSSECINFSSGTEKKPASNNGIQSIALTPSPSSPVLDALLYSSSNTVSYLGFGNEITQRRAEILKNNDLWEGRGTFCSDWAVDSLKSTGTRSMSRKQNQSDSDCKADWFITVTRGSTFGGPNNTLPYEL